MYFDSKHFTMHVYYVILYEYTEDISQNKELMLIKINSNIKKRKLKWASFSARDKFIHSSININLKRL